MYHGETICLYGLLSMRLEVKGYGYLTHFPQGKMAAISQTIFRKAFSWKKYLSFDSNFTEVCS